MKRILYVNRAWLKHAAWDTFDKEVCFEHINIGCMSGYDLVVYLFNNNAKILYV